MIIGIGTDIIAIARIESAMARFGDRFLTRIFTEAETGAGHAAPNPARFFAMRFAAKEAAWKALPAAKDRGVGWHDFSIEKDDATGAPRLRLAGRAAALHRKAAEAHGTARPHAHLALSDDGGFALAFVVLSAS